MSTLGLAVLGTAVTAPAAHAGGYGCSGNETTWSDGGVPVPGWDFGKDDGPTVGYIHEYFDGTYNCAVFVKSAYAGTPTHTTVQIYAQNDNQDSAPGTSDFDGKEYSWYAGPVTINGTGTCVTENVTLRDPIGNVLASWVPDWHSCG